MGVAQKKVNLIFIISSRIFLVYRKKLILGPINRHKLNINFATENPSQIWLLLQAVFSFLQKNLVSYLDFRSLPGVFENLFQRLFQIDNFFFLFHNLQIKKISNKMTKRHTQEAFSFYQGVFGKSDFTHHSAIEIIAFFSFFR